MVSLFGLFDYSRPQTTPPNAQQRRATEPTQQAINTTANALNNRIEQLTAAFSKEQKVTLPQRTPAEEEVFQRRLKGAAKSHLKRTYITPPQARNAIYGDDGGVNTFRPPAVDSIAQQKQRHFESVAQIIFNDHIKPQLNKALEQKNNAYKNTYQYKLGQVWNSVQSGTTSAARVVGGAVQSSAGSVKSGAASATQWATGVFRNGISFLNPSSRATTKTPGNANTSQAATTPQGDTAESGQPPASASQNQAAGQATQEGGTPETGGAAPANGKATVEGATDPKAANDDTKAETQKPETENKANTTQKEEQNWKNGYIGWKAGIGAALLAGGIALKMTIIGIIPGLIMAGAGAALMGWGGINYCMKDNK